MPPLPNSKPLAGPRLLTLPIALATLSLTGCVTVPSNRPTPSPKPTCGTVTQLPLRTLQGASAELRALPADSHLIPLLVDYSRMRDEARACRGPR